MERGGAMATGDTGPGATTMERTGAMATGPGATTTARGRPRLWLQDQGLLLR